MIDWIKISQEVLNFALPCWLVNMSLNLLYIIKTAWPNLAQYDSPLSKTILGTSTTWPGIPMALITGSIIGLLCFNNWLLGLLLGFCVYSGHALGSFIKRRAGYTDGQFMPLIDHGDYVILTGLVFGILNIFSWRTIILSIVITYLIHPLITFVAYKVGWHKHPL